jgi:hypothetical protein
MYRNSPLSKSLIGFAFCPVDSLRMQSAAINLGVAFVVALNINLSKDRLISLHVLTDL